MKLLLKELFSYKGRYNRARFLKNYFGIFLVLCLIAFILDSILPEFLDAIIAMPLVFIMMYVIACLFTKRARDLDQSVTDIIWYLIPLVNMFFILKLYFSKGTIGPNQYGPDPLEKSNDSETA